MVLRYLTITLLFIFIAIGTIGGCGGDEEEFICQESFGCRCECIDFGDGTSQICEVCCPLLPVFGCIEEGCESVVNSLCPVVPIPTPQPPPSSPPATPTPIEPPIDGIVSTPILITPIDNEIIEQNNPNIGCPPNPNKGFGLAIFFDWTDSSSPNGISGYQLFVEREDSPFPIIDTFVNDSEFTFVSCNDFVADFNLVGWQWTVQAEDNLGNLSQVSDTGTFQFEPCRLEDGTPCNSPPN